MSDGGKGSAPRPFTVDPKTFSDNWERTFGRKAKTTFFDDLMQSVQEMDSIVRGERLGHDEDKESPDEQAP